MSFGTLWLPVVVAAVAVFVASSIVHMVLKYHKADYKPLPNEDAVRDSLARGALAPGIYITPHCADMKQMNEPAMREKYEKGPVALVTVMPSGAPVLGKHLALWFGFTLLASFVAAYVARHTLAPGAQGLVVMRVTGTVAFAAYGLGALTSWIWKGQPWANTARELADGAIYAVVTGACFLLLWPSA
jgi:hypothetical protein